MRATFKGIFVTLGLLLVLAIVGVAAAAIGNGVASENEAAELKPYGQKVKVAGKEMNVVVQGEGAQTIVLLPGLGTAAPGIDFAPLVDLLDKTYRVVVVEPFGYGLSDGTDVPRTSDNIVKEVHSALETLKIDRYVLAGHSISGIYAMDYIAKYRPEVSAFVGIDSSVPVQRGVESEEDLGGMAVLKNLGIVRQLYALSPNPYEGLPYTDEQKQAMDVLTLRNAYSPAIISETELAPKNFKDARKLAFPPDLPVLLLYSSTDPDRNWADMHTELAATVKVGEAVPIEADHYLHHTKADEVAAKMQEFITAHVPAPPA